MVAYAVLLLLGAAGYAKAPAWLVAAAAACLTLADWRPWQPGRPGWQARASWSSKATTYLATGLVAHLVLATLAFGAGAFLRLLLG
jgi:hypothetical protein